MIAALLSLLLACGLGSPERIEDCPDEKCRLDWVLERYERDPEGAIAGVEKVEDPVERVVIVTRIVETWPGRTQKLCSMLTLGPPRTRCERINGRPHLQSNPPVRDATLRPAGGPSSSSLPTPSPERSPYYGAPAAKGPCFTRREPHVCYATQALRDALKNPMDAARACAGIPDQKWHSECLFSAAEMLVNARQISGLEGANDLCIAAVPFSSNCLAHVLVMLAKTAPDATERDPAVWAPTQETASAIERYWIQRDPSSAALFVDRYWSELMSLAYAGTPEVTGGPLDGLPERAWPQVRAAAALRLVEMEGLAAHPSLDAWTEALDLALQRRAETPYRPPAPPPANPRRAPDPQAPTPSSGVSLFQGKQNFWEEDQPGDEVWTAAFYWGTGRRAVSPDPKIDLRICALEAIAQVGSVAKTRGDMDGLARARALLGEGAASPEPVVKWTGERLLQKAVPP